jgi:hypothetical protein
MRNPNDDEDLRLNSCFVIDHSFDIRHSSFGTKRRNRIHFRGAAGRDVTREERDRPE